MRIADLYENSSPAGTQTPVTILVTRRFERSNEDYKRDVPAYGPALHKFLTHKTTSPRTAYNNSDKMFVSGGPLRGISHCHLIQGRVVLIYAMVGNELRLYEVGPHRGYDTPSSGGRMADFIAGASLEPIEFDPDSDKPRLTEEEMKTIDELIFEMAANETDRGILKAGLTGNWEDFMLFATEMVETTQEIIFYSFGGEDEFKERIAKAIKMITGER